MYDTRKLYRFGSIEESIAIYVINKNRTVALMSALFSIVAPEKASQLFKQYKGILFPEEKYDELDYIRKAKKYFEKIKDVVLYAKKA